MGVYYGMNGLWVPVGGQGGAAPIDPNLLAENIKSGVTISGVTGTFTNDGTAKSSDMADGVTAYVNGQKVTGNVTTTSTNASVDTSQISLEREPVTNSIYAKYTYKHNWLFRNGATLTYPIPASNFGDATAADVAFGKTFTSSAGLKVTGTGAIETHTLSVLRKSNFSMSYNGGQTKFEIEVPSMTSNSTILDFTAYIKYDNTGLGWIMFGLLPYNDTPIGICDTNANFSIEKCSITPGTDKVTILCEYSSVYDFLEAERLTSPSSWKDGGGFVVFQ